MFSGKKNHTLTSTLHRGQPWATPIENPDVNVAGRSSLIDNLSSPGGVAAASATPANAGCCRPPHTLWGVREGEVFVFAGSPGGGRKIEIKKGVYFIHPATAIRRPGTSRTVGPLRQNGPGPVQCPWVSVVILCFLLVFAGRGPLLGPLFRV